MTTVLAFLVTLGVLIVVHEYGHYRMAVACGVKVLRFSVGFGRVLWRHQRDADATEFVVCALPLGGYVRMLDEREDHVPPSLRHQAFNAKPLWARSAIVAAGPLANLGLAVLLYAASHLIGVVEPKAVLSTPPSASLMSSAGLKGGDWVRAWSDDGERWTDVMSLPDLRWQLTQSALRGQPLFVQTTDRDGRGTRSTRIDLSQLATREIDAAALKAIGLGPAFSEPVLGDVKAGGPAAAAGLRKGDRVIKVDGEPVVDAFSVRDRIMRSVKAGRAAPMRWTIDRAGQMSEITVQPRVVTEGSREFGRIDAFVGPPPETVTVRQGPVDALALGLQRTWDVSALTLRMLGRMLVGKASLDNISGPLTIAQFAGQAANAGVMAFLSMLALVSLSLGVLNLLPVPVLDGGHLLYYLIELVKGSPLSEPVQNLGQQVGIAVLLLLMGLALFNDFSRLLG